MQTASTTIHIFNGKMELFSGPVTVTVTNGGDLPPRQYPATGPRFELNVPFHNGIGDWYSIGVDAPGWKGGAAMLHADAEGKRPDINVLLVPHDVKPAFQRWDDFAKSNSAVAKLFSLGTDAVGAQARYDYLAHSRPSSLASLLNIATALSQVTFAGRNALSFFHALDWDDSMAQDRFFGFVDRAMVEAVRTAAGQGGYAEEKNCKQFHKDATCSWKQTTARVANVQFTFHENNHRVIDGIDCVGFEPDIDLYRDLIEHGFGEVFPNLLLSRKTDPYTVFAMRWSISQHAGEPTFNPGYELA